MYPALKPRKKRATIGYTLFYENIFSTRKSKPTVTMPASCPPALFRRIIALSCAALGALLPLRAHAQTASPTADTPPDYSSYRAMYRLPFSRSVDFNHLSSLHIRVSINGGPVKTFLVDTGSVGMIVAADEVPRIVPYSPEGSMRYSSSGIELDGVWTPVTLTFPDAVDEQGHAMRATLPILAVRERKVSGTGVNSAGTKPSKHPKVYMFGIGFGRGADPHPERNPFLNITEMNAGVMRRGYTITRDGFTLGLTGASVGAGYTYQKLTPRKVSKESLATRAALKDWETAPGSVTVGDTNSALGTILIDTGLTNMMIGLPDQPVGQDLPPGTPITVNLLSGRLNYHFDSPQKAVTPAAPRATTGETVAPADPVIPRRVSWVSPTHGVYVNTGLRVLAVFDYLYDADGGWLALRPVK